MADYRLPPLRYDTRPFSARALSETIDWGLQLQRIPDAWRTSTGRGVTVAILDTGTPDHDDLPPPAFSLDRTHTHPADRHGHATHCAGIVGARANGTGVIGVAPAANIGYVKVLSDSGAGSSADIATGIDAAVEAGAHVLSMSIGGGYDRRVADACRRAVEAGVTLIAAAGNAGYRKQNTVEYPGALDSTICVAAFARNEDIAQFSSGGPAVDIAAPGDQILSTYTQQRYRVMSGTSMATPFIAGLVALLLSAYATPIPDLPAHVRRTLREHATDRGLPGQDPRWGFGTPDMARLLDAHRQNADTDLWI